MIKSTVLQIFIWKNRNVTVGNILIAETKEFREARILGLPSNLSPSFGIIHPLPQRTISPCEALELGIKFPTPVNTVHYLLSG